MLNTGPLRHCCCFRSQGFIITTGFSGQKRRYTWGLVELFRGCWQRCVILDQNSDVHLLPRETSPGSPANCLLSSGSLVPVTLGFTSVSLVFKRLVPNENSFLRVVLTTDPQCPGQSLACGWMRGQVREGRSRAQESRPLSIGGEGRWRVSPLIRCLGCFLRSQGQG